MTDASKPRLYRPSMGWAAKHCSQLPYMKLALPDTPGKAAERGTRIHKACEEYIKDGTHLEDSPLNLDDEEFRHARRYIDWFEDIWEEDDDIFVEPTWDMSASVGHEGIVAKPDLVIYKPRTATAMVIDLKTGKRKPDHLHQLRDYQVAALQYLRPKYVINRVSGHLIYTTDNTVETVHSTFEQLREHADDDHEIINRIKTNPVATPNKVSCEYCPAFNNGSCFAAVKWSANGMKDSTERVEKGLTPDDISEALPLVGIYRKAADAIEAQAESMLRKGVSVKGFKRVQGRRPPRKWVDEDKAIDAFKKMRLSSDQIFQRKLISPTNAEKIFREGVIGERQWTSLQPLVLTGDPKPIVVESSDPRAEITPDQVRYEFDVI